MNHGKLSTYAYQGCRCVACRQANADYHRKARGRRMERLAGADVQHGTASTYRNWGCRCDACSAAHGEVMAAAYAARKERLAAGTLYVPHGTHTGYGYGCRCDECRAAERAYQQDRRAKAAKS